MPIHKDNYDLEWNEWEVGPFDTDNIVRTEHRPIYQYANGKLTNVEQYRLWIQRFHKTPKLYSSELAIQYHRQQNKKQITEDWWKMLMKNVECQLQEV